MNKIFGIFVLAASLALAEGKLDMCNCATSFMPMGCCKDQPHPRMLRHLILNERTLDGNYAGQLIDWTHWHDYLPKFICRCAQKAKLLDYDVFGIEYYGECWADKMTTLNYAGCPPGRLGDPEDCVGRNFKMCGNERYCAGKDWRMMVYRIVDSCNVRVEKLGCYTGGSNLLPSYVLNDRDPKASKSWSGQRIDWLNWYQHVPDFVCRCAQKIKGKKNGWEIFGIRNWGECWSGNVTKDDFLRQTGVASPDRCKNQCFDDCDDNSQFCTGLRSCNTIYAIVDNSMVGSGLK